MISVSDDYLDGAVNLNGASAVGGILVRYLPEVFMQSVTSGGDLVVETLSPINNIAIFTSAASGAMRVSTPSGQNSFYIDTCYSAVGITVEARSLYLGSGVSHPVTPEYNIDDTITVARCYTSRISVDTAGHPLKRLHLGGNDTVYLYGNYIAGPASAGTFIAAVDTGDGNDTVVARYNVVLGDMQVTLGDHDDILNLVGNQITAAIVGDGGTGANRLFLLGNQYPASSFNFFQ
jgi:hypothetical protein